MLNKVLYIKKRKCLVEELFFKKNFEDGEIEYLVKYLLISRGFRFYVLVFL